MLFLRIVSAHVFWASGRSKIMDGTWFSLRPEIIDQFRDDFHTPYPALFAPLAATMEHVLPILLVLGLFSRFAALGLVGMTLFIQFFVFPDAWWTVHSLWLGLLLTIVVRGGGVWSLDRWVMQPAY
ncbi:MAG: DoxX family protein [Alphaproteobacteria bacterium]|nr:DoxX family protein [Alphaproteobacteria bacterium]MDE2041607.1 DoxX family protein [Alphaproteobacteria bacterium]